MAATSHTPRINAQGGRQYPIPFTLYTHDQLRYLRVYIRVRYGLDVSYPALLRYAVHFLTLAMPVQDCAAEFRRKVEEVAQERMPAWGKVFPTINELEPVPTWRALEAAALAAHRALPLHKRVPFPHYWPEPDPDDEIEPTERLRA